MLRQTHRLCLKILGGFVCLHENGWTYTWWHGLMKLGNALRRYGARHLHYREVCRKGGSANSLPPRQFSRTSRPHKNHVVALFAMYSPDGAVPESTWLYLNGLREVADEIIVCSDCAVCGADAEKMRSVASCAVFERHGEYDFGSFRRAYRVAEENGYLCGCERLIMANDSCIGPIFPLSRMMEAMSKKPCDFWGQTSYSFHGRPHVQSYFMVFSGKVVNSGALCEFFTALPVCRTRADVISSCEIAMTEFLVAKGFKWSSYVPYRAVLKNPTCSPVSLMAKYSCPLIKIKALCGETFEPVVNARTMLGRINPEVHEAFLRIADEWEPVPGIEMPYD